MSEDQSPRAVTSDIDLHRHEMSNFNGVAIEDPMNRMWAFSVGIKDAIFISEHARGNASSVFYLVAMAQDLGLKWTHALRSLYMTPGGRVGMEGNIMQALLFQNKFKLELLTDPNDQTAQEYKITRPDSSFSFSRKITWEFALTQGWPNGKNGVKPPWNDRANMLRRRSLAFTAREVASDLLGGIYLPEELDEIQMEESTPSSWVAKQEDVADRKAEADPGYAIVPKAIAAVPAEQVVTVPQKQPEPVPVTTPVATAQPVAQAVPQPRDDAPKATPAEEKREEEKKQDPGEQARMAAVIRLKALAEKLGVKSASIAAMISGIDPTANNQTPPKQMAELFNSAMDSLEAAIKTDPAVVEKLQKDPKKLGETLKKKMPDPASDNPYTQEFGWTNKALLGLAYTVKANKALGGWIETLRTTGIGAFPEPEALAALTLYKAHPSAYLICKSLGSSPSVVLAVFQAHMAELGDITASVAATLREIKGE